MRFFVRISGIFVLLALIITPALAQTQDEAITVVGSGIALPVFEALAGGVETTLQTNVTGTGTGFTQFCAGEADVTTANRPISASENGLCSTNNITYFEVLLGQEIAVLIANPASDYAACLTADQVNQVIAPSAQGTTTNWTQIVEGSTDAPISVFAPSDDTSTFAILDELVEGDGIRGDATLLGSGEEITAAVSADVGAIGVVTLADALAAGESVKILDLDAAEVVGCRTPNADNVENNLYPLSDRLYAYTNVASLSKPGLTELLEYITSDASVTVVEEAGFTAPTANALQANRDTLQAAIAGEPLAAPLDTFAVPTGVAGTINVGGAAVGFEFLQNSITAFNASNPDITINTNIDGEPAGFRRLCNGEVDLVVAYRDLNEEELSNCAATNITTLNLDLGNQSVVLLANAQNDYLACLTTEQIAAAFQAADTSVSQWNEVNEAFPETPLTLFAPDKGSSTNDLLLGGSGISREDLQYNSDALYRAAATANVDGGVSVYNWPDYQAVIDGNQANVQLVSVDGGSGCVAPSVDSIADGSYPITRPAMLILNQDALARPEVQAFVWFLMGNENYTTLESVGLVGLRFGDLPEIRSTLQQAFLDAEIRAADAAAAAAEATAEATVEGTAEAEATNEATEVATEEATPEVTAEATEASE